MVKIKLPSIPKIGHAFASYLVLVLAYIVLNILLPVDHATLHRYHLSVTQYHELILGIILPLLVIWFTAFFGYERIRQYREAVQGSPEEPAFHHLTRGFGWLAWGLPITSIISVILNSIAVGTPWFKGPAVITDNYISLAVAVGAFHFISIGTHHFNHLAQRRRQSSIPPRVFIIFFIFLVVSYCFLISRSLARNHAGGIDPYHLPDWIVMLTLVAPYLYAWFLGLWSTIEIGRYQTTVSGVLYKRALRYLASGIGVVILTYIAIQYISSASYRLTGMTLNSVLAIIYALLILYALGFILIASGAQKLKKIEEV